MGRSRFWKTECPPEQRPGKGPHRDAVTDCDNVPAPTARRESLYGVAHPGLDLLVTLPAWGKAVPGRIGAHRLKRPSRPPQLPRLALGDPLGQLLQALLADEGTLPAGPPMRD